MSEPEEDLAVLGKDMAGNQIPLREKLRPLYAFMVLIMEAVALGTLIAFSEGAVVMLLIRGFEVSPHYYLSCTARIRRAYRSFPQARHC